MALDSVPWLVAGGAQHSAEVARSFAFAATNGSEGVVHPLDLKVFPRTVPGAGVQVIAGSGLILSNSIGGARQTYIARNGQEEQVAIAATTSAGPRSDLIVLQVEDPNPDGETWQPPADRAVGPYVFFRVVSGVPAGTTRLQNVPGYEYRSAITLARIDLPASTATVQAQHIVDLRQVANPRTKRVVEMGGPPNGESLTSAGGAVWPSYSPQIEIPAWATHMSVVAHLASVGHVGGDVAGVLAVAVGNAGATQWRSSDTKYDEDNNGSTRRVTLAIGGKGAIDPALRGKLQPIRIEGKRTASVSGGALQTQDGTHIVFDVYFEERRL